MSEDKKKPKVDGVKEPEPAEEAKVDSTAAPSLPEVAPPATDNISDSAEKAGVTPLPEIAPPEAKNVKPMGQPPGNVPARKKVRSKRSNAGEGASATRVKEEETPGKADGSEASAANEATEGDSTATQGMGIGGSTQEPSLTVSEKPEQMQSPRDPATKEAAAPNPRRGSGKLTDRLPPEAYASPNGDGDANLLEAVREIRNDLREILLIMRDNSISGGARLG